VKKPGYESQTQYIKIHNKNQQSQAQRLDFTLQTTSTERADLQRLLRQYLDQVNSHSNFFLQSSFHFFISVLILDNTNKSK